MTTDGDDPEGPKPESSRPSCDDALTSALQDVTRADEPHLLEGRVLEGLVRHVLFHEPQPRIGRFRLLAQIGGGGMSLIYSAYDEDLARHVALKLLRTPAAGNERLRREAQALARLSHPNVVAVHDCGRWEDGLFIAMELVRGQTLDAWLRERQRTWQEVVEVFLQAGRGLAAAHRLGLVHRDFKPTNLMVDADGRTRVVDFGLVRLIEHAGRPADDPEDLPPLQTVPEGSGLLTPIGAILGTPAYMAPEQHAGGVAGARSDQFSFCVTLHEAVFGVRPGAAGGEEERVLSACKGPVPARLLRAIDRGLAPDPAARWPSMVHLLAELEQVRRAGRRRRIRAAALGIAAIVAGVSLTARQWVASEQRARAALERQAALERDARLVVAAQRLLERDPTAAAAALREVRHPDKAAGWRSTATAVLLEPLAAAAMGGLDAPCQRVAFDRDGGRVLAFFESGDVMIGRTDGAGVPARLGAPPGSVSIPSPDREWVLTWHPGGDEVLLTRIDGGERRTFGAPGQRVSAAAFTANGAGVLTVSPDGVVRRWRPGAVEVLGAPPPALAIGDPSRWRFGVGPAGRHASALSPTGAQWLWSPGGDRPPARMADHGKTHRGGISSDGRWLGSSLADGGIELWDTAGGPARVPHPHAERFFGFDVSRDGRWLATSLEGGAVRVAPVGEAGAAITAITLRGHAGRVGTIQFDPAAARLVTTSHDRTARVWSLDGSGDVAVLRGHAHHVVAAAFSPDGRRVATCSREPSIRIWDVSRRPVRILGRHDGAIWSARPDRTGRRLVTAGHDGTARIWDLGGERPPIVLRGHTQREVFTAMFSPDGRRVATGAADGTARLWSADGAGAPLVLDGHDGWVYGMAFSPDGRLLATGSKTGEVRLSPTDGAGPSRALVDGCAPWMRHDAGVSRSRVHTLAFGPEGDRLAADAPGCAGQPALLWTGGGRSAALGGPRGEPVALAMSPDGRVAASEKGGLLRVWGPDGDGPIATLRGHAAEIHHLAWSRDGRRLLSASFDGSARIWDLAGRGEPLILRGHEDWVLEAAFDATGGRVVTASADRTARVWRLDEPDQPIVLRGHEDHVRHAGFTPEGRVVTASIDGTVRLWSLDEVAADPLTLMAQLRRATTVCLSPDQRMQHLGEPREVAGERFADCERAAGR
jgi:WD40 repeat protein